MPKMLHKKGVGGVFLATPAYGGLTASYTHALFNTSKAFFEAGINCELAIFAENCHVDDSRNVLVRDFLESDCDIFVFLDADLRWEPKDLLKLIRHDRDVVAGIYPLKQSPENYPVRFLDGEIWADSDGLVEVESVPTGFLKIKRHVLETLAEKAPKFTNKTDHHSRLKIPLIFERTMENETRWGGDYTFCRKWRATGGKIYIDPEMKFAHEGTSEWVGSLGNHLRKINGITDDYIKGILAKIQAKKEKIDDLINLVDAWDNEWSVEPDFLAALILLARGNNGKVLECGSGLTTMVLDALGQKTLSLEHDRQWVDFVGKKLNGTQNTSIKHSPIKNGWYDVDLDEKYSLVVCDGPPRDIGRDGLIPALSGNMENGCLIIVDDAGDMTNWEKQLNTKFSVFGDKRKYAIAKVEQ